ncbi:MAG: RNA-directed DNA polymerase [Rhodopirellula sp.]|nr:RNA-directed DNA polymerase [Rhodopirellula sp.]
MIDAVFNGIEIAAKACLSITGVIFLAVGVLIAYFLWNLSTLKRARPANLKHWNRVRRGDGFGVEELARRLGVTSDELAAVSPNYTERFIEKRSGGTRRLLVPSPELKELQQKILRRLLARLSVHPAATGFEPGTSIVHNAAQHVDQAVVVCMDVSDFFPQTSEARVTAYFQRIGWNRETAELLTRLTTWEGGLPQGAPTSPRLSNLVNHVLDARIERFVECRKGNYTRYADDISVSFPKDYPKRVRGTVQVVGRHLKAFGYQLNAKKTRILRQHQQQKVTGLVVNDRVNVPRNIRRKLRAVEHRLNTGQRATMTREQFNGWKALLAMVEQQRDGSQ